MNPNRSTSNLQSTVYQYTYNAKKASGVCLQTITDYSPFGVTLDGRTIESDFYRRGFNGMEKDDELKGSGNSYDFGARMYDSRVGRFLSLDAFASKFASMSPFSFAANIPIMGKDINGDSLYIMIVIGSEPSFDVAAITRMKNIEKNKNFNRNSDKVIELYVSNLSDIKNKVSSIVSTHSKIYGKTAEVAIWSHSAIDGPRGSEPTTSDGKDGKQMTLTGWNKIEWNWSSKNSRLFIFGCNSATTEVNFFSPNKNFSRSLSEQSKYKDVVVWGQQEYSYPSIYTDERYVTLDIENETYDNVKEIYFVGSDGGIDDFFFNNGYKMRRFKNGNELYESYQPGKKAP
jgi:RHS repeat-associated protein